MAFSQGFNNTFRSLDNAFQWRSAEDENARQFDTAHEEKQRVNDSRIDLNGAQIGRLQALTKLTDQEVDHNEQMNPLKVENQSLQNVGQQRLNENRQIANDTATLQLTENKATSGGRVAATNAQNRFAKFDAATKEHEGRATNSKNLMLSLANEDGSMPSGEELAADPKTFTRAIAAMSASSEIAGEDFGEDSIALMKPHYENGRLVGYIAMEESTPGGPLRVDPEAVDANGEPRIIPVEEAATIYDALVERLDQSASWGAEGGSARDNLVLGQARQQALATAEPRPEELPVGEAYQGRPPEEIEAEGDALEAELAELQTQREALESNRRKPAQRLGGVFSEGRLSAPTPVLSEDEKAQLAELDAREQQVKAQLGEIATNLQAMGQNQTLGSRQGEWQQGVDQQTRTLGNTVRRNEALNGTNYTADQTRNLMSTGRADKTPEQVQADFAESVDDLADQLVKTATFTRPDGKGGFKKVKDDRAGEHLRSQFTTLANSDPTFQKMVQNPRMHGMIQKIGLDATALAGPGGEPNMAVAWSLFRETGEAGRLGNAMQYALAQMNPDADTMDPELQAQVGQAVADVMRAEPELSPKAAAQRALLNLRN